MHNGPYNIVVPTLALASQQGGDGEATINFLQNRSNSEARFGLSFGSSQWPIRVMMAGLS